MKLIAIRSEVETSLKAALPGWSFFSARTVPVSDEEYPCVNTFFGTDRLISYEGPYESRFTPFSIEAGFKVKSGDAERDMIELRQRIKHALELNPNLNRQLTRILFVSVEFAHSMPGERQQAVLFITARFEYEEARALPPPPVISPSLLPTINGVKQADE